MLAGRPGALACLQPPDDVAEEFRREASPAALLHYEVGVAELMHRALVLAPVVAGETGQAGDGHLEAPPREASDTIPDIANYAAERHLQSWFLFCFLCWAVAR